MDASRFAADYERQVDGTIRFSGLRHELFLAAKARHLLALGERRGIAASTAAVLDVGCGVGALASLLEGRVGALHGVDVVSEAVAAARSRVPSAGFQVYDGERLPFPDGTFDIVFASCVVHHVPPPAWDRFVREMSRVARPGGIAVLFEHNPLHPLTRLAVSRCAFDRGAVLLGRRRAVRLLAGARLHAVESRYVLPFPWSGPRWERLEGALGRIPLGVQYYAAGRKVPAARA